ncbi:hypothetical protein [Nitrosospira sp. Nsp13]|uniref:hypothetical protein n=1 Tax=Nitrosospira sp. Nsp13 TaxID=1855332 RepID=UPI00088CF084|nr:hypothetical protein [Nitrosospira sp. Nsp13]SCY30843.1 hypothetical protein SAMN05216308_10792 [Nitrosospira sp. Nsp13]
MNTFALSPAIDAGTGLDIDPSSLARLRMEFLDRGAAVLGPPALVHDTHANLLNEALAQRQDASWSLIAKQCPGEISQHNLRAHLGRHARSFLSSASMLACLEHVTGQRLAPSWSASCYTYYDGPGQHMGEHCDKKEACRIALLVYLQTAWMPGVQPSAGLQLHVFRGDNAASGLLLRITGLSNRIVILNGAEQAHLRPALAAGEHMTMLAGCYRSATGSDFWTT